jgi:gamma-F420-2:alpha-L-glutamate ligase
MLIWLIYERAHIPRNQFFIDRWLKAGHERGIRVEVMTLDAITPGIRGNFPALWTPAGVNMPDCVVMRANAPLLSAHLEAMGIPVFNNARLARLCNDKRLTHQLASGIAPMMDTAFINAGDSACPFSYPVVVKSAHGNGGRQVFLAEDDRAYAKALAQIQPDAALVQPLCDTPGRDVRVYMLGHEVKASMMRQSATDFRSNVGLGAEAVPYDPGAGILEVARTFADRLNPGLIGVDFIFHRGQLLFNEIEDAVGTRMLYALGRFDIVKDYLAFILKALDKG